MLVGFEDLHNKRVYVNSRAVELAQTRDVVHSNGDTEPRVELTLSSGHQVFIKGYLEDVVKRIFY